MHIVERRDHADDRAVIDGDDDVVASVGEKFCRSFRQDRMIEHAIGNAIECASVRSPETS